MKKIFFVSLFILPGLLHAQFKRAELQASGLTCSMCSNAINKALKTLPFVETIGTDLNKNLFTISFKQNMAVDFDLVKKKVEDAGFSVAGFWVMADLHGITINKDEHVAIGGMYFHFLNVQPRVLNGEQRLQVIDKNFVPAKEYKKFSSYTAMPCYQSGIMSACCKSQQGSTTGTGRIYHVTI